MTVSEIVAAELRARRITAHEAAKTTGVSPQTMRRVMRGEVVPQMGTVRQLADGLGLDFNVLWDAALAEDRERTASAATAA